MYEGGTRYLSFHTCNGPSVNLHICKGMEAMISSILLEVPERGGDSRIFCCSPQLEALCSSLMLQIFCSISWLYRARVRVSYML